MTPDEKPLARKSQKGNSKSRDTTDNSRQAKKSHMRDDVDAFGNTILFWEKTEKIKNPPKKNQIEVSNARR